MGGAPFGEQMKLQRSKVTPTLYGKLITIIPWQPNPAISNMQGLWIAAKDKESLIWKIYHITKAEPTEAIVCNKQPTEQLQAIATHYAFSAG